MNKSPFVPGHAGGSHSGGLSRAAAGMGEIGPAPGSLSSDTSPSGCSGELRNDSSLYKGEGGPNDECCGPGSMNDTGAVLEYAAPGCVCPRDPTEWWRWTCKGKDMLAPAMWLGGWQTQTTDVAGFRDRNVIRHFLRHAPLFATAPNFDTAVPVGGDLVVAIQPPTITVVGVGQVPANTSFSAIRIDINTPMLQFPGPTSLTVSVGPAPGLPAAAFDTGPAAITCWTEVGETLTRLVNGWQRTPQVSLMLPMGTPRQNQTIPNVMLAQFPRVNGVLLPINVRVRGFAAGTVVKAQIVTNASIGVADLARSV